MERTGDFSGNWKSGTFGRPFLNAWGVSVPYGQFTEHAHSSQRADPVFRYIKVLMITPPGTLPTGTKLALASQFSLTAAHLARGAIAWFSTGSEVVGSVQDASFLTLRHVSLVDNPSLLQYISDSNTPTDLAACPVQAARFMSTF